MRRTTTLVLALGAVVLAACGGADSSPHAAAGTSTAPTTDATGASPTGPVPWADLPPTHPHIPSTRVPPRPDPALARAARPCRAGDLVLKDLGNGAAAGTMVKNLRFTLTAGHRPCAVSGRPSLSVRTVEGINLPGRVTSFTLAYRSPVRVTRAAGAVAQIVWPSACYARSGSAAATLTYAGRSWTVPMGPVSRNCHFEPERPLQSVGITHFSPPDPHRAHPVTAYTRVRVHGPGTLTAHLERPVFFRISLTSPTDLPLDPCPDFRLGSTHGGGGRFALNCAAVPYRDDQGRPYLPAGRPVTFEMRLDPVDSLQKYWWSIIAPGSAPYAAGVITLR